MKQIFRKSISWAVMNGLSRLFIRVYIWWMPEYNHNDWTYKTNNQSWQHTALCAALSGDSCYRINCDFAYLFLIFTVSHLCICLSLPSIISLKCSSMVLLDVSSNNFSQIHIIDHFDLILFKCLSCGISFSDILYLLPDHITNIKRIHKNSVDLEKFEKI